MVFAHEFRKFNKNHLLIVMYELCKDLCCSWEGGLAGLGRFGSALADWHCPNSHSASVWCVVSGFLQVSDQPWYSDGLQFSCTGCGQCCTGAPGFVWVTNSDVLRLAEDLSLTIDEFSRQYLRFARGRLSLIEKPNGDCVFWSSSAGCEVYEARPDQCRSWPFWNANLETARRWGQVADACPGCNHGEHHDLVNIQEILKMAPDRTTWPE